MSDGVLEERVGALEREQARFGEQLGQVRRDVADVGAGVKQLLERDAKRSDALTWRGVAATVLVTASIVGTLATFNWWMVAVSPAVKDLTDRLTDLDHDKRGRVPVLERRIDKLDGWQASVRR